MREGGGACIRSGLDRGVTYSGSVQGCVGGGYINI